jgi:hypothetical protein
MLVVMVAELARQRRRRVGAGAAVPHAQQHAPCTAHNTTAPLGQQARPAGISSCAMARALADRHVPAGRVVPLRCGKDNAALATKGGQWSLYV